jgi:hypothetical protein
MSGTIRCGECGRDVLWTAEDWDAAQQLCRKCAGTQMATAPPVRVVDEQKGVDSMGGLTLLGLACLAGGFYYLVIAPGNPDGYGLSGSTVNLQRLYIGQTLALAGAIFCAAAWRPR